MTKVKWEKRPYTQRDVEVKLSEIATNMLHTHWDAPILKGRKIRVKENRRLSRALGRIYFNSLVIEMSGRLLDYGSTETILDVLLHEVTHYALYVTGKPYRDGEEYFENELKRVGASSTETLFVGVIYRYECECRCVTNYSATHHKRFRCGNCDKNYKQVGRETHDGEGGIIIEDFR